MCLDMTDILWDPKETRQKKSVQFWGVFQIFQKSRGDIKFLVPRR